MEAAAEEEAEEAAEEEEEEAGSRAAAAVLATGVEVTRVQAVEAGPPAASETGVVAQVEAEETAPAVGWA